MASLSRVGCSPNSSTCPRDANALAPVSLSLSLSLSLSSPEHARSRLIRLAAFSPVHFAANDRHRDPNARENHLSERESQPRTWPGPGNGFSRNLERKVEKGNAGERVLGSLGYRFQGKVFFFNLEMEVDEEMPL